MITLLRTACGDLVRVFWAMPNVALVAFTIFLGLDALGLWAQGEHPFLVFVVKLLGTIFLSLYSITVHRFVILGDVAAHYPFAFGRRGRRFVVAGFLLTLLAIAPMLIGLPLILVVRYAAMLSALSWVLAAAVVTMIIAMWIVLARLSVMFPAIAVDAPGASWVNALADTKGYAFRIFMTYVVGILLFLLAVGLAMLLVWGGATIVGVVTSSSTGAVVARVGVHVGMAALSVLYVTFFVALASRIFQTVADRLAMPASAAPA
jgi:hypothetical protein